MKNRSHGSGFLFCNRNFIPVIIDYSFGICYTVTNFMPGGVYD